MSRKLFYLAGIVAVIGCASTPSRSDPTSPIRRGSVLSAEEMASAHADAGNLYDAIARLRSNWLAPRGAMSTTSGGTYAEVFVDDQLVGDISALKNISAYQVGDVRYYDVSQAGARFGIRAGTSGAIEVSMKKPGR